MATFLNWRPAFRKMLVGSMSLIGFGPSKPAVERRRSPQPPIERLSGRPDWMQPRQMHMAFDQALAKYVLGIIGLLLAPLDHEKP